MPVTNYGTRKYKCGCVASLWKDGTRQGLAVQCFVSRELMTAHVRDPRGESKEVSAEWRDIMDAHYKHNE